MSSSFDDEEVWTKDLDELIREAVARYGDGNWIKVAQKLRIKHVTPEQCQNRWKTVLRDQTVKGPWTDEEDALLVALVDKYGPKKWSTIASFIKGRIGKQCRERWLNHLSPDVTKVPWKEEEDQILISTQQQLGNKWSLISKLLPGRSENAVKNRFNSIMGRNGMRRKKVASVVNRHLKKRELKLKHSGSHSPLMRPMASDSILFGDRNGKYELDQNMEVEQQQQQQQQHDLSSMNTHLHDHMSKSLSTSHSISTEISSTGEVNSNGEMMSGNHNGTGSSNSNSGNGSSTSRMPFFRARSHDSGSSLLLKQEDSMALHGMTMYNHVSPRNSLNDSMTASREVEVAPVVKRSPVSESLYHHRSLDLDSDVEWTPDWPLNPSIFGTSSSYSRNNSFDMRLAYNSSIARDPLFNSYQQEEKSLRNLDNFVLGHFGAHNSALPYDEDLLDDNLPMPYSDLPPMDMYGGGNKWTQASDHPNVGQYNSNSHAMAEDHVFRSDPTYLSQWVNESENSSYNYGQPLLPQYNRHNDYRFVDQESCSPHRLFGSNASYPNRGLFGPLGPINEMSHFLNDSSSDHQGMTNENRYFNQASLGNHDTIDNSSNDNRCNNSMNSNNNSNNNNNNSNMHNNNNKENMNSNYSSSFNSIHSFAATKSNDIHCNSNGNSGGSGGNSGSGNSGNSGSGNGIGSGGSSSSGGDSSSSSSGSSSVVGGNNNNNSSPLNDEYAMQQYNLKMNSLGAPSASSTGSTQPDPQEAYNSLYVKYLGYSDSEVSLPHIVRDKYLSNNTNNMNNMNTNSGNVMSCLSHDSYMQSLEPSSMKSNIGLPSTHSIVDVYGDVDCYRGVCLNTETNGVEF